MGDHSHVCNGQTFLLILLVREQPMQKFCRDLPHSDLHADFTIIQWHVPCEKPNLPAISDMVLCQPSLIILETPVFISNLANFHVFARVAYGCIT